MKELDVLLYLNGTVTVTQYDDRLEVTGGEGSPGVSLTGDVREAARSYLRNLLHLYGSRLSDLADAMEGSEDAVERIETALCGTEPVGV